VPTGDVGSPEQVTATLRATRLPTAPTPVDDVAPNSVLSSTFSQYHRHEPVTLVIAIRSKTVAPAPSTTQTRIPPLQSSRWTSEMASPTPRVATWAGYSMLTAMASSPEWRCQPWIVTLPPQPPLRWMPSVLIDVPEPVGVERPQIRPPSSRTWPSVFWIQIA
jgi:hypothetical protein